MPCHLRLLFRPFKQNSVALASFIITFLTICQGLIGQQRPPIAPNDYDRWENLGRATLSPNGEWIAYEVTRVNEKNELRYQQLVDGETIAVHSAQNPQFSSDSRWLVWTVEVSDEERERLEKEETPVRDAIGLTDLLTSEEKSFDNVRARAFDPTGSFLVLHGYPPDEPDQKGANLRVLDLQSGRETTFGNVAEFTWSDSYPMLAMVIATGGDEGNGVQVYEPTTDRLQSLDTSESAYTKLAWRKGAAALAVLRSHEGASKDQPTYSILTWTGLDNKEALFRRFHASDNYSVDIVKDRTPTWSEDGRMISVGVRQIDENGENDESVSDEGKEDGDEPELPNLQIWHSRDVRIYPQQKVSESDDEHRSQLSVWHLDTDKLIIAGSDLMENARVIEGWNHVLEDVDEPYGWGQMFGRPYHDVWAIDLQTGERHLALEHVRYEWPSAGGRYLVSFDGANYSSLDLETGQTYNLTSTLPTVFADTTYDTPTDMLPPFGFSPQWLEHDAGILLNDEHDVWRIALDGSSAFRITDGQAERVTHRVQVLGDDDVPGLNPEEPIYLSLHGEWSEKRGYARVMPDGTVERLLYEDEMISGLLKADSADVYVYRAMRFSDPPDYFVSGPDLADATQVTKINPFISEYAWGHSELIDFTSEEGHKLQAVLYYPVNYVAGTAVPTIVYTYEMRSQTIHNFGVPTERQYYNFTAWTQQGYAVLQPDIVYTAREPGMSALASVRAAVAKAVEMGIADPDAVGLIGHSWGGYQATFLPTRTNIFAASVAGAPLTDFVSFMGQIHWNSGAPELTHWETGQGRMEVPFWEDPEAHRRNSPIHKVHEMETPLLMAFGDNDGTVDWDQGTEFYNFARRAGKQMVLLVYEGENHGFSKKANQVDYHRRILEWFDHYLKGEAAQAWITDGVALKSLEDEKKRVATNNDVSR